MESTGGQKRAAWLRKATKPALPTAEILLGVAGQVANPGAE